MAVNRRIAILGAGKIGESLLAGLLSSGWRKPGDIVATGRRQEHLEELQERHGRETSTQLVVQTMLGTAKLLRDEQIHPVELREAVTSPGGTTIRAIRELEQAGVRAAFLNAIQAAMERSKELAAGES